MEQLLLVVGLLVPSPSSLSEGWASTSLCWLKQWRRRVERKKVRRDSSALVAIFGESH